MADPAKPRITECKIGPYPENFYDPMPEVRVTLDNGAEKVLFEFYPDELSFRPTEFIGLTEQEAVELKVRKDTAYLRS